MNIEFKVLCRGIDCPIKENCKRYFLNNNLNVGYQSFQVTPFDQENLYCKYFINKEKP